MLTMILVTEMVSWLERVVWFPKWPTSHADVQVRNAETQEPAGLILSQKMDLFVLVFTQLLCQIITSEQFKIGTQGPTIFDS